MKIIVVCLGNICRSPMAEGILKKKISERNLPITVDSAGTADYHVGECPDNRAIAAARSYNVDISKLRGRQFTRHDFDEFDRIYAMDNSNYKNIIRLARNQSDIDKVKFFYVQNGKGMDVPDPWFGDLEGFFPVFNLLENAADKIIDELVTELKPAN
jgi:protein-tyrosine phosphatase